MAPRKQSPREWLEALPDTTGAVRVRVGNGRNLPTVAVLALDGAKTTKAGADFEPLIVADLDELAERAEREALSAGWPDDYATVRFHAYATSGGELRTFQSSSNTTNGSSYGASGPEWAVIGRLTDGLLAMAGECRRTVDILTETLAHRETVLAESLEHALSARQDAQDAEMQAYAAQLAADEMSELDDDSVSSTASQVLEQVAQTLMARNGNGSLNAGQLRTILDERPELLDELLGDDYLIGRVLGAWQARQEAPAEAPTAEPPAEEGPAASS